MLKIKIKQIKIRPVIGVYKKERLYPQDIFLDLDISFLRTFIKDQIETTLDYTVVVKEVERLANSTQFFLIETLANLIIEKCLSYPNVSRVKLRLHKPSALTNGFVSLVTTKACS